MDKKQNTGDKNSGHRNSGSRNSGDLNSEEYIVSLYSVIFMTKEVEEIISNIKQNA
jgi:hypothetical protein